MGSIKKSLKLENAVHVQMQGVFKTSVSEEEDFEYSTLLTPALNFKLFITIISQALVAASEPILPTHLGM